MKSKRFAVAQVIAVLKQAEAGAKVHTLCSQHGISVSTLNRWKAKYVDVMASEPRRLDELEMENAKLKEQLAEAELDKAALKDLLRRSC